jgi:hypothetical protein
MKNLLLLAGCFLHFTFIQAQTTPAISRVHPTNWWTGIKYSNVQLLVYGPNVGKLTYSISYPGVKLNKTNTVQNPNYAFLDVSIAPAAKAGSFNILGKSGNQTINYRYELLARVKVPKRPTVTSADLLPLLVFFVAAPLQGVVTPNRSRASMSNIGRYSCWSKDTTTAVPLNLSRQLL